MPKATPEELKSSLSGRLGTSKMSGFLTNGLQSLFIKNTQVFTRQKKAQKAAIGSALVSFLIHFGATKTRYLVLDRYVTISR